jgi:hypothetical protein
MVVVPKPIWMQNPDKLLEIVEQCVKVAPTLNETWGYDCPIAHALDSSRKELIRAVKKCYRAARQNMHLRPASIRNDSAAELEM